MEDLFRHVKGSTMRWVLELLLALRALFFLGTRYTCPCCGWRLRAFTHGGRSLQVRDLGYCPRCNSKARHRRIWLSLKERTNLFSAQVRLLHISPKYALSRRFTKMPNLDYLGVDLNDRPNIDALADVTRVPIRSDTFDALICIHVMEEVGDDRTALQELYRVLKPGGWAAISVPTRLDQRTYEDPSIRSPKERMKAFGEEAHVRVYGHDLVDRLEECGFQVELDLARDVGPDTMAEFGLRDDENIFYCTKS